METLLATSPSWTITVVRIVLGVIFFAHGAQKVLGWFGGYGLRGTQPRVHRDGGGLPDRGGRGPVAGRAAFEVSPMETLEAGCFVGSLAKESVRCKPAKCSSR